MICVRIVYHIARADFLERVRTHGFLAVLAATVYAAYWLVPPLDAGYLSVSMGGWRGTYNSAWMGTMYGFAVVVFLPLLGFYLVKNTVARDHNTRVGEILAATPLTRIQYVLGKFASNVAVFGVILAVMTVMAGIMQLIRAEDLHVYPGQLLLPIWSMGLPLMAVVAALAVIFEVVRPLQGTAGSVLYFCLWIAMIPLMFESKDRDETGQILPYHDLFGISHSEASIQRAVRAAGVADFDGGFSIGKREVAENEHPVFAWNGIEWTAGIALYRLVWLGAAALTVLLAAPLFDRLDPGIGASRQPRASGGWLRRQWQRHPPDLPHAEPDDVDCPPAALSRLEGAPSWRPGALLLAELRLLLKGRGWWWYGGTACLIVAGISGEADSVVASVLPLAWLWPLPIWSSLGVRETRCGTEQLVLAAPHPVAAQPVATWLAGALVALTVASGVIARLLLAGSWTHLGAVAAGALFVPALALALGVWSRTQRLFEITYLLLWYLAWGGAWQLDYMGLSERSLQGQRPLLFVAMAVVLLGLAMGGRSWRLRRA
jgi:hypothetical protein